MPMQFGSIKRKEILIEHQTAPHAHRCDEHWPSTCLRARSAIPNKVQTHIGELTFDHGVPTEETSKKLYYELDYHRAVQAYLWSLPIVGQAQWRQSYLDQYDIKPNQIVFATKFNERSLILTANESTPYLFGWTNVTEKAAIIEVPPEGRSSACSSISGSGDWRTSASSDRTPAREKPGC